MFVIGGATLSTAQPARTKQSAAASKTRSTSSRRQGSAAPTLLIPAKAGSIVSSRRSSSSTSSTSSAYRSSSSSRRKKEQEYTIPPPAYEPQRCSCQGGTLCLCVTCKAIGASPSYQPYQQSQRIHSTKLYRKRSASPSLPTLSEEEEL